MRVLMGLREANQRFSRAIREVKAGREVVLTDRGKPVAVIKPLGEPDDRNAILRRLEATGLLRPAQIRGRMRAWTPRPIKGRPISETLREDREAR